MLVDFFPTSDIQKILTAGPGKLVSKQIRWENVHVENFFSQ